MQKNILVSVIITSLIVAIIASVATLSLTGNVIKLNPDKLGKYKVYTSSEVYNKIEIDTKLKSIPTNENVLEMLQNKCTYATVSSKNLDSPNVNKIVTCNKLCSDFTWNPHCINGILWNSYKDTINSTEILPLECDSEFQIITKNPYYSQVWCNCCSP